MKVFYSIVLTVLLIACASSGSQQTVSPGPLHDLFIFSNDLTIQKYNLETQNSIHSKAVGLNDEATIKRSLEKFKEMHGNIIREIESKYPVGTLKLPFEQIDNSQIDISNVAIAKYQFPWDTATRLSYIISFDCTVKSNSPVTMVRFEFIDNDNDIFMSSNTAIFQNGTYTFEIRPEVEFFNFQKVMISVL